MSTLSLANIESKEAYTPPVIKDSNGTECGTFCRAWVNFDGSAGAVSVRASFNVSSVTENATGDYTINFTTAMPDANYSVNGLHQYDQANVANGSAVFLNIARRSTALSSSSVRVLGNAGNASTLYSGTTITISVFR